MKTVKVERPSFFHIFKTLENTPENENEEDGDASATLKDKMADVAQIIEDFDTLLKVGALHFYLGLNQSFDNE